MDKSENKSEEMIDILQYIHEKCIARSDSDNDYDTHSGLKRVFGSDVLTNERAYSAQLALHNGMMEFSKLQCVIQRPEGLHRMMNLLLVSMCLVKLLPNGRV